MSDLKIGSLCSGYGGLDLAVEAATGARTAWVSDIDKGACKVLAHRFPDAPNIGDMTTVDWFQVEPVDILCGGTPCQDLSHAGKRAGMTEGTRSNLWVAMRDAIANIRPGLVVWENVGGAYSADATSELESRPGLLADTRRRDGEPVLRALGRVLGDLASLGFDAEWRGLRAADVGAAHGRLRVFVVAWPAADTARIRPREGGTESARIVGRPDAAVGGLLPTPTVNDAGNSAGLSQFSRNSIPLSHALLPTPAVNDMGATYTPETWDEWTAKMKAAHGNGNGHGKSLNVEDQRLLQTPSVSDVLGGHERRGGERGGELLLKGQAKEMHGGRWGDYAHAIARHEQTFGRPAPAPTETGPRGNPRLSCHFDEWLMGLPAGWIADVPDITHAETLRLCGNGVVPLQAQVAIADMLPAALREAAA